MKRSYTVMMMDMPMMSMDMCAPFNDVYPM